MTETMIRYLFTVGETVDYQGSIVEWRGPAQIMGRYIGKGGQPRYDLIPTEDLRKETHRLLRQVNEDSIKPL